MGLRVARERIRELKHETFEIQRQRKTVLVTVRVACGWSICNNENRGNKPLRQSRSLVIDVAYLHFFVTD